MPQDYRISLFVILIVALVAYGIFLFPALTSGGNAKSTGVNQARFDAVFNEEMNYCRSQSKDSNCRCFASISGNIMLQNTPRVPGAVYADKRELARGQAARSC